MSNQETDNLFYSLFGFEKTKGKLNLVLLLLIHLMAWCFIFLLPLLFYPVQSEGENFFLYELLSKTALIGLFYLNYYLLLPRFFEKKKYLIYFLLVIILIIGIIFWDILLQNIFPGSAYRFNDRSFFPFNNISATENTILGIPQRVLFIIANRVTSFAFILLLVGGLMRLGASYLKNQNEKKALENANLNAELNLLKSQINPHFLFNTLNGIYALAHEKSEKTETSILKLSEMLRYMLYESAEEKVALSGEINYITNYIQLQRMRLSDKIKIKYEVTGKTEGQYIAPFLLITFIENAFKHGVSYAKPGSININIKVFEKTLTLFVENPFAETDSFTVKGLGLKNAERRLDLLYQGKYNLQAEKSKSRYIVNLKLELSD